MMKSRHAGLITALALAAGVARSASAASPDSPWGVAIYGGDSLSETGELRKPSTATFTDFGTVDPSLSGASGRFDSERLSYDDIFHRRFDTGLELNYSFSDSMQTYGRFGYESLNGQTRTLGTLETDVLGTSTPIHARFGDDDNKSLEFGSRYFWHNSTAWEPFAGVALGATRMESIRATLDSPDAGITAREVRFTRPATLFSQSLETGVEFNPSRAFGVRFSIDASHTGTPPSARDPALSAIGFDAAHDADARWTFPVAIAATWHLG